MPRLSSVSPPADSTPTRDPAGNTAPTPWYQHRWPWLLMLGPGVVVIAGVITAWLAWHGQDGLVVDDYYKEGKAINQSLARDNLAKQWQVAATLRVTEAPPSAQDFPSVARLDVQIRAAAPEFLTPQGLRVRFIHPTQAQQDQQIALQRRPTPSVPAPTTSNWSGILPEVVNRQPLVRWQVMVEDTEQRWRLLGAWPTRQTTQPRLSHTLGYPVAN